MIIRESLVCSCAETAVDCTDYSHGGKLHKLKYVVHVSCTALPRAPAVLYAVLMLLHCYVHSGWL
jgi:hypothetical protein